MTPPTTFPFLRYENSCEFVLGCFLLNRTLGFAFEIFFIRGTIPNVEEEFPRITTSLSLWNGKQLVILRPFAAKQKMEKHLSHLEQCGVLLVKKGEKQRTVNLHESSSRTPSYRSSCYKQTSFLTATAIAQQSLLIRLLD